MNSYSDIRVGESVYIVDEETGEKIRIWFKEMNGGIGVKLGIDAPMEYKIHRTDNSSKPKGLERVV